MRFYVASKFEDGGRARLVCQALEYLGHECTLKWFDLHHSWELLDVAQRQADAVADVRGVQDADLVVFVPPGARGAHVELGAALGLGKPVVMLTCPVPLDALFYFHPLVHRVPTLGALLRWVESATAPCDAASSPQRAVPVGGCPSTPPDPPRGS